MELELVRLWPTPADCTGTLSVDGIQKYATLELPIGNNVPYVNCIPAGVYPVQLLWSARFNRTMPHLGNTAPRGPILIHYGNTAHDTGTSGATPGSPASSGGARCPEPPSCSTTPPT